MRRAPAVLIAVAVLTGCSDSPSADPPATTTATSVSTPSSSTATTTEPATTTTAPATTTSSTTTTTTTTTTTAVAPTTSTVPGPLEFVDGAFLGIAQGSLLHDAAAALAVTPARMSELAVTPMIQVCTGTEDPWVIQVGGLMLYFEGSSAETAFLTNWTYVGGPVGGYTELIAPPDIRIGDSRDEVTAANPDFMDLGDEIHVFEPVLLRFGFVDDTIEWLGIIDCAMEYSPVEA